MALKWGEIQELRSRVPREYAPWGEARMLEPGYAQRLYPELGEPTPETLTAAPKPPIFAAIQETALALAETLAAIGQPDTRARETDRTIYNLGMNTTEVGSFIATGSMASRLAQLDEQQERKRKDDEKFALDRAREALQRYIERLEGDLAASESRVDEIDRRLEATRELKRRIARGEAIDPSDKRTAELLRQAGISAEDAKRGDLSDLLNNKEREDTAARNRELEEQERIKTRINDAKRQAAELDTQARAGTFTPEIAERLTAQARTDEGVRQLSNTAFHAQRQETKNELADLVGSVEHVEVRAGSLAVASESVAANSTSEFASDESDSFDFDAPSPGSAATASAASSIAPTASFSNAPDARAAFASATGQTVAQPQALAENDNTLRPVPLAPPPPKAG